MYSDMTGAVTLDADARNKAIRLNPKYAFSVPWASSYGKIATLLGFSHMSPGAGAFADGVAAWQARGGSLKIDGILGPNTWTRMEPECAFSGGAAAVLDPDWLKETPHKARAEPAQGGRENTGMWVGIHVDFGWMAGAAGRAIVVQKMYSITDPGRTFLATADRVKIGVGAGSGLGVSAVLMSNVYEPHKLIGYKAQGYDFNFAVGAKIGAAIKAAINVRRFQKLAKLLDKLDEVKAVETTTSMAVKGALKKHAALSPDEVAALAKIMKEAMGVVENAEKTDGPNVMTLGLPVPGLWEVSAFYQDDKYVAVE